ncbi:ornithine cyclodeaminase family protein [Companilactobacillus sp. FL22-1]|uniref:ornithine cyclodeaminase family protein n=1 Tax=Companilactobacillus sp. FL22-1 TaxID=3373892 RepID=UPI003754D09A
MIYLSAADIKKVFTMRDAIDADKEALSLYSLGKANIPLRTNIDIAEHSGQSLYMPGYVSGDKPALGQKIVSVYPENISKKLPSVPATMIVLDATTGIVNAVLDGTYLTQLRTGAVQGLATELLSNEDSKTALLIGTGGQGMSQLEAMLTVRNLTRVYVFDIDKKRSESFCDEATEKFSGKFTTTFESIVEINSVLKEVDIITTVTTSRKATFNGDMIKDGAHINGVGAYTKEMHEIPEAALIRAKEIFVDTNDGVLAEAGDIITPLKTGVISKNDITGELGQLINGEVTGRQNKKDITIFKTVGTAALDVVVADRIVRLALQKQIGIQLN